jgi:DNA-binding GntR family transcriptional regulator
MSVHSAEDFRRPPTAQEAVLEALRRAIGTGELPPGQQIRQEALAEAYGVSRVPLREALKILEGEGQVTYEPHRGYFVTELSVTDLIEVYRIRTLLESEAVRVGVPRLSEEDIERAADAVADCEAAAARGDLTAMTAANRRLHFGLVEAARMPRLARLVRVLWDATDAYRSVYYGDGANRDAVNAEHRAVLDAVRRRDVEEVVRLLDVHREHAVDHLRSILPT